MSVRNKKMLNINSRLRYWKERLGNAIWMLRTGRFKLFLNSIYIEFYPTIEVVKTQLHLDARPESGSAFVDKRKVTHPGFRPTTSQPSLVLVPMADAEIVARELRQILFTLDIREETAP